MLKLGTSELENMGLKPNLGRDMIDLLLNNTGPRLAGDHTVSRKL